MKTLFKPFDWQETDLAPHRIDIWQYPLIHQFASAHAWLNQTERERAERYYFSRHQRRFTVARALLRFILGRYVQLAPLELQLDENAYGKPQLMNAPEVHFNLSHSQEVALLAIGLHQPLGIDLEFFSARPYIDLGLQMFSAEENQALATCPLHLQPLGFFHIWAQKEAFIKACGLGLSYPTEQFTVPLLSAGPTTITDPLHHKTWQMVSFMPQINCCAALCHHQVVTEIRYLKLNTDHVEALNDFYPLK